MNYEPIIEARLKRFKESFQYENYSEDQAFELFANYSILLQHQPDAFNADSEMLESASVGGENDGGIDGIAIKVNGTFINSKDEIEEMLKCENISTEFIFIQSKNKAKFSCQELNTFLSGIRAFFDDKSITPFNEKVELWRELKRFIFSDEVMCQWQESPSVRCYYVTYGKWLDFPQHTDVVERFKKDLKSISSETNFHFLGAKEFKEATERNENKFNVILPCLDIMSLPEATKVDGSCLVLCSASEFIKLLDTEEGIIRKSLFNDNVRDFQGLSSVNKEIKETILHEPEKFVLFNNGITIVCTSFIPNDRKLKIVNPQIVNGCQTSSVLFASRKEEGSHLENISLVIKVISTTDGDLLNDIVRGTNKQNIVLEEAFETTKQFHKDLENFMNEYNVPKLDKIFYERRAKQYAFNPTIKQYQKCNLRILTQYFVATIMQKPHLAHRHEAVLLQQFEGRIFHENHSKLPYVAIAYSVMKLEQFLKRTYARQDFIKYKAHILMIYFVKVGGAVPDLSKEKGADKYANAIIANLSDEQANVQAFENAIKTFNQCRAIWCKQLRKSKYAIKDTSDFTKLVLRYLNDPDATYSPNDFDDSIKVEKGTITYYNSKVVVPYGYISTNNEKVYFSRKDNATLPIFIKNHALCEFKIKRDNHNREKAYDIKLIE